jgi:hypothetical protein
LKLKKKVPHRVLTTIEVKILNFLWKWKLANGLTLVYGVAPQKSFWRFYRTLRRLYREGYIKEVSDSKVSIALWTLTKKGFSYINDGSMGLVQKRYQPQALSHDYWATVFHLGEFLLNQPSHVELVSEQEFTAKEIADLPKWLPQSKEHIPDGFTRIQNATENCVVAFEIELSTKSRSRYEEMIRYLDQNAEINWVCWLCENDKIIETITKQVFAVRRQRPYFHHFVLLKDVQKLGWNAPFLWGELIGKTPMNLLWQQPGSQASHNHVTSQSHCIMDVYLSNTKSPRKFKGLGSSVDPLEVLTPKGSGI